jgi:hypothetical protein
MPSLVSRAISLGRSVPATSHFSKPVFLVFLSPSTWPRQTSYNESQLTPDCRIFEIGPEFALLGRIDANFGLKNVNAVVEVNHNLGGASFAFPPQGGSNTGGISSSSKREYLLILSHHPNRRPIRIYRAKLNTLNHRGVIQRQPKCWRDARCISPPHTSSKPRDKRTRWHSLRERISGFRRISRPSRVHRLRR